MTMTTVEPTHPVPAQEVQPTPEAAPTSAPEETKERNPFVEKVLKEKKNAMAALSEAKAKITEYEAILKDKEESELRLKEDHKALAERYKQERDQLNDKIQSIEIEKVNGIKRAELRKELTKMGADEKSLDFMIKSVDLPRLKYDTDHKLVLGVEDVALELKEQAPALFGVKSVGVDSSAPSGLHAGVLSVDEYRKLPISERKKPEVRRKFLEAQGIKVTN